MALAEMIFLTDTAAGKRRSDSVGISLETPPSIGVLHPLDHQIHLALREDPGQHSATLLEALQNAFEDANLVHVGKIPDAP